MCSRETESPISNTLEIPASYSSFAYTTGTGSRTDSVKVYNNDTLVGLVVRTTPSENIGIYSINALNGYNANNGGIDNGILPVKISPVTTLTISNTVTGEFADMGKSFEFEIFFQDSENAALEKGITFNYEGETLPESGATAPDSGVLTLDSSGKGIISLSNGQSITVEGIPSYCYVKIVENNAGGYSTTFTDNNLTPINSADTGFIALTTDPRTFDFTNYRGGSSIVDAGVTSHMIIGPTLILLALIALIAKIFYDRRRKEIS